MSATKVKANGGSRILAVDDVEAKRYAWERILTRAGFDVFTASTGEEALTRSRELPDLIILDVRLPDINGLEVCRRIKEEPKTASIPVLHISASLITAEDRTTALQGGADGYLSEPVDPEELVATVNALLRMRRAEELARKAAAEWQTTFDMIQDGIVVADPKGTILKCNRAFSALSGTPPAEILGRNLGAFLADRMRFDGGSVLEYQAPNRSREAVELRSGNRWIRVTVDPVLGREGVAGSICIFSDVTPRKEAEEAVNAAREKLHALNVGLEERVAERTGRLETAVKELEAFTYTIAHDLRAPLRAMHRFSEILIEEYGERLEAQGQDYARRIIGGAERMDLLIDDLLEYSRLAQSGIKPQRVSLSGIVGEVCRPMMTDSSARVPELTCDENLPEVIADRVLLTQVLSNLISNAVKFVASGVTPRIRVGAERQGDQVLLSIQDNGIGVPAESQARLFKVFERLGTAKDFPGTGIGLAIVRRAMDRMGGDCGVESEAGKGSRFWIRLPAVDRKPEEGI